MLGRLALRSALYSRALQQSTASKHQLPLLARCIATSGYKNPRSDKFSMTKVRFSLSCARCDTG